MSLNIGDGGLKEEAVNAFRTLPHDEQIKMIERLNVVKRTLKTHMGSPGKFIWSPLQPLYAGPKDNSAVLYRPKEITLQAKIPIW